MAHNPILDEIRRTREELLPSAGGTMAGLIAQLKRDQRQTGRVVLDVDDLLRNRRVKNREVVDPVSFSAARDN